ncbi:MAG: type II toxin-antitoxin system RelE/ParE family toxin [Pseudolabrys sp.]
MRVRYTLRAQTDLDVIFSYLDTRAPGSALEVKATIERRIAMLGEFPHIAPETDIAGVYELTIVRYAYKVYFDIDGDSVEILHIRHASRRPWTGE